MRFTKANVAGFLIGLASSMGVIFFLYSDPNWLPPLNASVPSRAPLTILAVILLAAWNWYHGASHRRKYHSCIESSTKGRPKLRRIVDNMGSRLFAMQFTLAAWLLIFANHGGWNASSVGLDSEWSPWCSLAVGFGTYVYFLLLVTIAIKKLGIYQHVLENNMQVLAYLWPRNRKERGYLWVGVCVLNPIVEELLFRGILVHQFGLALGSQALPIALGLAASLGNHAYQGRLAMTTHLPFYAIVVGLLYSPAGLWGAIGFHFAGDFLPFALLKQSLLAYRKSHRHRDWQSEDQHDHMS